VCAAGDWGISLRNCNDDVTQQICRDLRSAKRAACVSSDFLEFAGQCRSAKRARTCVRVKTTTHQFDVI
jgi:hypothetical protein